MTREETLQVLSILKAAYPHSYRNMTKLDAEAAVNLWYRQFENAMLPAGVRAFAAALAEQMSFDRKEPAGLIGEGS